MRIEKDQIRALGIAAGLFVLFGVAVLFPLRYQRVSYQKQIEKSRQALGIDLAETKGLGQLNQDVITLRQVINGAQQYIPQEDELADAIRGLNVSLTAFGITNCEINTQVTQHYADYSVIPITLQFNASFPAAYGVLKRIESMPRLIRVNELTMQSQSDDPREPLKVKLTLSTFIAQGAMNQE